MLEKYINERFFELMNSSGIDKRKCLKCRKYFKTTANQRICAHCTKTNNKVGKLAEEQDK